VREEDGRLYQKILSGKNLNVLTEMANPIPGSTRTKWSAKRNLIILKLTLKKNRKDTKPSRKTKKTKRDGGSEGAEEKQKKSRGGGKLVARGRTKLSTKEKQPNVPAKVATGTKRQNCERQKVGGGKKTSASQAFNGG